MQGSLEAVRQRIHIPARILSRGGEGAMLGDKSIMVLLCQAGRRGVGRRWGPGCEHDSDSLFVSNVSNGDTSNEM